MKVVIRMRRKTREAEPGIFVPVEPAGLLVVSTINNCASFGACFRETEPSVWAMQVCSTDKTGATVVRGEYLRQSGMDERTYAQWLRENVSLIEVDDVAFWKGPDPAFSFPRKK